MDLTCTQGSCGDVHHKVAVHLSKMLAVPLIGKDAQWARATTQAWAVLVQYQDTRYKTFSMYGQLGINHFTLTAM